MSLQDPPSGVALWRQVADGTADDSLITKRSRFAIERVEFVVENL